MTQTVTVLGAGIVGICTALSLVERGVSVTVIDRGPPGQETSFGNAGVISPWSIIPQSLPGTWRQIPHLMFGPARALSVRAAAWPAMVGWGLAFLRNGTKAKLQTTVDAMEVLCGPSIDLYRRHLDGTGEEHLVTDAMYVHAFRDGKRASLKSIDYAIRQERGADMDLVGKDELRRIEPAISSDFEAAVLIKGQARALSPGRVGEVLATKAKSLGVKFIQKEIRAVIRLETGWCIECEGENLTSKQVVVAMGAWSAGLMKSFGYPVPMMAERGYHVEFPDPQIELNNSIMDVDAKCVASSMEGGLRFAGQAEFASIDAPADERKRALLARLAQDAFPGLNSSENRFWMGRRPSFPDSLPVLGELSKEEGLFLNFGHSHYGLMMAPKSGEIVADLVTNRTPNCDLGAFLHSRF